MIGEARKFAETKHAGQLDRGGWDYMVHLYAVATQFDWDGPLSDGLSMDECDMHIATAFLHDVLEDTDATVEDLETIGMPKPVIDAVVAITKDEIVGYAHYIENVARNPIARRVKIADLEHNMDVRRLRKLITDDDVARLRKYHAAWLRLTTMETGKP